MSTINKKPFIKTLVEDMTAGQIATLQLLVDGGGNQDAILRTMNIKPVGNRTHITVGDKGVHLCDLEVNFSLFKGYLIYTDHYCVLIHFTDSQVLGMFKIDLNDLTKFETVSEELSVLELRNELNDTKESEEADIIETVNEGIVDGDIVVPTYKTFPSTWNVNGTTKAFCDNVAADLSAVEGMAYLGEVYFSDLPASMVNGELVVEIKDGDTAASKVITLTLTSGNVEPYHWEYTYWNNGSNVSDWVEIGGGMKVVTLNDGETTGTLTDEEFEMLIGDNSLIKHGALYFSKTGYLNVGGGVLHSVYYSVTYQGNGDGGKRISNKRISIEVSTKTWTLVNETYIDKVTANDSLPTNAQELTSLTVGDLTYKVPQGMQVVEINSTTGTLTDEQYAILSGNNGILKYGGTYYTKKTQGSYGMSFEVGTEYYPQHEASIKYWFYINVTDKSFTQMSQNISKNVRANVNPSTPSELVDLMIGNDGYTVGDSVKYLTTAPVANNTSGRLQIVVLSSEPATRYDGYLYIITGAGGGPEIVDLENSISGTLTNEQYALALGNNCIIKSGQYIFYKASENTTEIVYHGIVLDMNYSGIIDRSCVITKSNQNYVVNAATKSRAEVKANPTLSGNESNLTSIEIGGTKYKAGGDELDSDVTVEIESDYTNDNYGSRTNYATPISLKEFIANCEAGNVYTNEGIIAKINNLIDGHAYRIILIGLKHDVLSYDRTTKVETTWQFLDMPQTDVRLGLPFNVIDWSSGSGRTYVNEFLDGTNSGVINLYPSNRGGLITAVGLLNSLHVVFESLPLTLQRAIKTVDKTSYVYRNSYNVDQNGGTETDVPDTYHLVQKIFILTIYELGFNVEVMAEGTKYTYLNSNNRRKRYDAINPYNGYWSASPRSISSSAWWTIDFSGNTGSYMTTTCLGIAPAFCI